jgi:hypothetical protein
VKLSIADEFSGVSAAELAAQTARPENGAMRSSNRRQASEDDLLALAKAVLAVA